MIVHIVLFKWTEGASQDEIDEVMVQLNAMDGKIPGIREISCGVDFTGRGDGYTHGLLVKFNTKNDLLQYGPHPVHRNVVENFINPIRGSVLAFDYEILE